MGPGRAFSVRAEQGCDAGTRRRKLPGGRAVTIGQGRVAALARDAPASTLCRRRPSHRIRLTSIMLVCSRHASRTRVCSDAADTGECMRRPDMASGFLHHPHAKARFRTCVCDRFYKQVAVVAVPLASLGPKEYYDFAAGPIRNGTSEVLHT